MVGPEYKEYRILITEVSNHGILPSERTKEELLFTELTE